MCELVARPPMPGAPPGGRMNVAEWSDRESTSDNLEDAVGELAREEGEVEVIYFAWSTEPTPWRYDAAAAALVEVTDA